MRNVDQEPEAFNEMVALGLMSIPVTVIGDYVIRGYDERKLKEALAATE